ncbi:flagellar hook assembly protein FlgD [Desulfopila aestuarii]|uniref:Basal-body rod modification protein FlgD n=1 Tax=Desulfopila aestuarii DSM 18488 TaxID=1121416 RepID=A0A1M7YDQ7_9BACT|nr:flagellar hook assembly protein FlgD [Desulfopila aestuarii]SHO50721.1 flagellar basal-body rod modification protein FlgD [Desulfopila aestuarii DSM 18488]
MTSALDALFPSSPTKSSASTSKEDKSILGKEDFLSLLVAQMKNQDPLNPDDPTQFTAQLAQFSQLEQLFNLNGSMENLVSSFQNSDKLTALNTIGKEVAFKSDVLTFNGQPVTLGYSLDEEATDVSIALQKDGATVAVLKGEELNMGTHYITWDGLNSKGDAAGPGNYTILIKAKNTQGENMSVESIVRSIVTGADLDGTTGGTLLTGSGNVSFNTIFGVFDPTSKIDQEIADENG